jgi:hypothetical protein
MANEVESKQIHLAVFAICWPFLLARNIRWIFVYQTKKESGIASGSGRRGP